MSSLVIAQSLVLDPIEDLPNNPLIGYRNIVAVANIAAGSAEDLYPAVNLANPATHLRWQASTTDEQYLTITTGSADDNDYIGVARHNWASAEIPVSIEIDDGSGFAEIVAPRLLLDDGPAMFRYPRGPLQAVRIRLQEGAAPARAAVVYNGALLTLERKLYQGQTAINHGRDDKVTNGRSESGNFLGRIVTGSSRSTKVPLTLISADWYHANFDRFLAVAKDRPFFFAWRPEDYPFQVGYVWLTNQPRPLYESPHGLVALDLELGGVV